MKAAIRNDINGMFILDKPKGYTSNDCLAIIKKMLHPKKLGHTGTLDPNATGVIVCLLGKSTKCQDFLMKEGKKVYEAELILGFATNTEDITGKDDLGYKIDEESIIISPDGKYVVANGKRIEKTDIETACKSFIGHYKQIPPMYSAKKVDGHKLYDLARKGKEIERKPCDIEIFDIKLIGMREFTCIAKGEKDKMLHLSSVDIEVSCGKGTYIRTLCVDIGKKLGVPACMGNLRRIATGRFHIEDSISLEQIKEKVEVNDMSFVKPANFKDTDQAVTFGKYETLHIGHQKVIETLVRMAKDRNLESTVVLVGKCDDNEVMTDARRVNKLKKMGVDNIIEFPLDDSTKYMQPEKFVKEILFDQLKAKTIVVGTDTSFGNGGKGDSALLKELGKENGVSIELVDKVKTPDGKEDLSSTYVKELYARNKDKALELLGEK